MGLISFLKLVKTQWKEDKNVNPLCCALCHLQALVVIGVQRIMMSRGFGITPYPTRVFMLANF
jgi:hypothetical protein